MYHFSRTTGSGSCIHDQLPDLMIQDCKGQAFLSLLLSPESADWHGSYHEDFNARVRSVFKLFKQ